MCRISGIAGKRLSVQEMQHQVASMCQSLRHGGSDDEGLYTNEAAGVCLGHRRLSIIDLSAQGHQPMADSKKRAWITFNGEIYNYLNLKIELKNLGASFESGTDTEIIIQAYLYWGVASFARLRGIFAFALFDETAQLTYLVRDTNGIKPLYYHAQQQQLSFASEVKALRNAGIASETDDTWKIKFLTYGHIPEPYTNLKNVLSLPKGTNLRWQHADGTFQIKDYSVNLSTSTITNVAEVHELIRQTLTKAINRQLLSDAPIGIFLSGGIDSSLLSLLASKEEHNNLQYISIYFNESHYNERNYQNIIAQKLSGQQHTELITYNMFDNCLPQIIESMDLPTTDGINTWFISKYAHEKGLKAVLSGLGADELFGGYPSFKRAKYINAARHLPINFIGKVLASSNRGYKRLSFLKQSSNIAEYLFLRGIFIPQEVAALLGTTEAEIERILYASDLEIPQNITGKAKISWLETNLYMQNQLLRDTDVMSMSHGLEVRVPFLDEDFVALVNSISPQLRFSAPPVKKLLIDSFKDLLPEAIWNRPKMGFTFPLQQWMKQYSDISNEHLYTSPAQKSIIRKFNEDKVHWSKAFALYQLRKHV